MGQIYLATNFIELTNDSFWARQFDAENAGHLQIVFTPDGGGPLLENEIQLPSGGLIGNWNYVTFGRPHIGANTPFTSPIDEALLHK